MFVETIERRIERGADGGPPASQFGDRTKPSRQALPGGFRISSGLSTLNKDQIAERGARMARRDD